MIRTEQLVEQLSNAARGCSPAELSALLDRGCGNSPELRHLVEERLLAEGFGDRSTLVWADPSPPAADGPQSALNSGRFAPGQVIAARFTVIRYIARGGMGEVYEVEDHLLQGAHVALKMILPGIASDANSSRRFEQEVLLARKVIHPNLCPIYDIARSEDPPPPFLFLTMKLLAGETLSSRLRRAEPIARQEAITIFRQIVAGLAAIHAAGVIHRDIKPNNVMLDYSGPELCLSIMDFGLARLHQPDETMATQSLVAGTPGYMAPEILQGQEPSRAADVFALGVLMHQVLTRERPRIGTVSLSVEPSPALDTADAPAAIIDAVKEFLANDPNRRCLAFEQIQTASTSDHWLDGWEPDRPAPFSRKPLSRRQFVIGSVLTASAVAGGVTWKWNRFYDILHPLPAKRFVALLGWPSPKDSRVEPTIRAVVDTVASELARAEAFDHNLFIIPQHVGKDVVSLAQVNDVRESVGANLVLSASGILGSNEQLQLLLRVIDPAVSRTLRQRTVSVPMKEQLSLPGKAVLVAADLLDISKSDVGDQRSQVGTSSSEAYALFQTAEIFRSQENDAGLDAAIEKYQQAIEVDPSYALAYAKLALAYFRSYILHRSLKDMVGARNNCAAALREKPDLVEAHLAQASVLDWTGDKPGALREIATALSIDPRDTGAMLLQGQEFTRSNRWSDAEETFGRLQAARPNYWLGYEELGIAYSAEGKYSRAAEEFWAASLAAPKRTLPVANLSTIYLQMGNLDHALDFAGKSLAIMPNDPAAAAMSAALRCQGKFDQALSYALKAVELNPEYPDNWLGLGDCYSSIRGCQTQAKDAYSRAVSQLEQIVQTNPTDGPIWMLLAFAQAKLEQADKSLKALNTADDNFSGDLDSQLLKVRTLALLGKRDEALATASVCLARGATPFQFEFMPDIDDLRSDLKSKGLLSSL
jgi:eukaryotic-like serine/threonine-protein kinase